MVFEKLPDNLSIQFLGDSLIPSNSVSDLDIILDQGLTYDEHDNNVVKCCIYSLTQISLIRHLLNKERIFKQ